MDMKTKYMRGDVIKVEVKIGVEIELQVDRFKEGHGRVEYIVNMLGNHDFWNHGIKAVVRASGEVIIKALPKEIKGRLK